MVRRLIPILAAAVVGAALSQCGAKSCDVSNCLTGCCNADGQCQQGSSHWACGTEAQACQICAAGDRCNDAHACETVVIARPDPDAACRKFTTWPTASKEGGYFSFGDFNYASLYTSDPATPPDGGYDELDVEVWYLDGGSFAPRTLSFSNADTYFTCDTCVVAYSGCVGIGQCQSSYLAQRGTISVTQATQDEGTGQVTATATNLKLLEWDLSDDTPVAGGGCIAIESAAWDVSWKPTPDAGP